MGKALYRKYRSKKLSEIVGQDHVTTALNNSLKNGTISHAYLFTGPRGTGKTSIARILAHEVNNLPYDEDATHLDIIEIDAASNRRIDEIRTLRERVHNAPSSAKYKVYIIDEVHMLTKEAFNALLKTLEEPPEHVIFILATTEAHKLPETIISRTQRYTFKPADPKDAAKHMREIAKKEGIKISDDALDLVAEHGNGSFRDSISLLDQVSQSGDTIELTDAQRALGIAPQEAIDQLMGTLANGSIAGLMILLRNLQQQGYQAVQIAKQLSNSLRQTVVDGQPMLGGFQTLQVMQQLLDVPTSHDPASLLEIILLDVVLKHSHDAPPATPVTSGPVIGGSNPSSSAKKPAKQPEPVVVAEVVATVEPEPEQAPEPIVVTSGLLDETTWQQVLHSIKQKHNTLYGIARMANPIFNDGELTLVFQFPFHQKRLNDSKHKQIISDTILEVAGLKVTLNCIVDKNTSAAPAPLPPIEPATPSASSPLDTISNIFGGGEVLE